MNNVSAKLLTRLRLVVIAVFLAIVAFGSFSSLSFLRTVSSERAAVSPTPARKNASVPKYSQFEHSSKAHRLECSTCHKFPSDNWKKVRAEKDAFPDITEYPKHESCLNCHRQQFFRGATPNICSICHVNAFPPRDPARNPFPNPREVFDLSANAKSHVSDFSVGFPHDKHIEIVSRSDRTDGIFTNAAYVRPARAAGEESCTVCHKTFKPQGESDDEYVTKPPAKLGDDFWLKKGTFKTMPIGHTSCFTCHSADTGILPAPNDCATCHKLKMPMPPTD
ncbi:MAG: cytochrome c3 family protein, partial [Acidobacteriota bacterium]